jgi:hypothetical protein
MASPRTASGANTGLQHKKKMIDVPIIKLGSNIPLLPKPKLVMAKEIIAEIAYPTREARKIQQ